MCFFANRKFSSTTDFPRILGVATEDVPMIQEAHVGVGVSGLQAALSDGYQVQYLVHLSV